MSEQQTAVAQAAPGSGQRIRVSLCFPGVVVGVWITHTIRNGGVVKVLYREEFDGVADRTEKEVRPIEPTQASASLRPGLMEVGPLGQAPPTFRVLGPGFAAISSPGSMRATCPCALGCEGRDRAQPFRSIRQPARGTAPNSLRWLGRRELRRCHLEFRLSGLPEIDRQPQLKHVVLCTVHVQLLLAVIRYGEQKVPHRYGYHLRRVLRRVCSRFLGCCLRVPAPCGQCSKEYCHHQCCCLSHLFLSFPKYQPFSGLQPVRNPGTAYALKNQGAVYASLSVML